MSDLVKRADEALKDVTPGPWEAVFDRQTWGWLEVDGPSFKVSAPTRATDLSLADAVQRKKDARFIAAARELVPAMRDRIEADAKRIAEIARLRSGGDDFDALIADARAEAEKAMRKFPQPNYVISKVAEEAGEVVKAAIHCAEGRETVENLRGEMKQLIAMIYRLWVEGDGVHGLPPARAALTGEKGK